MNWNRADELLERYYAGQTSPQEEQELKQFLSHTDLPKRLQQEKELFHLMQMATKEETVLSDDELFSRLDQHVAFEEPKMAKEKAEIVKEKPKAQTIQLPVKPLWQIAAAIALLALGYWLGSWQGAAPSEEVADNSPQTEQLAHIQKEVAEMKILLSQNSPSQRIKAVNYVQDQGTRELDQELIQVLIQTMHFDDNVNVRMAAIRALLHFQDQPLVRKSLVQSLQIQSDPHVQLQLIDGLVEIGEKEAVPHMQELLENKELQEVVKSRLQQGIGILI